MNKFYDFKLKINKFDLLFFFKFWAVLMASNLKNICSNQIYILYF